MRILNLYQKLTVAALLLVAVCSAQIPTGAPGRGGTPAGPKLSTPRAYPQPGSYPTTESVYLYSEEPGVDIHYSLDGSNPTAASPRFDPAQLLFIAGVYEGNRGLKAGYTIRAIATKTGSANSDIATFLYTIDRKDRTAYTSEEVLPGVRMIRDSENDKMFLIRGTQKAILIDTGMGQGALKEYVTPFTGGLPLEVIFTHNHGDHIGQADQFIEGSIEYIGEADRASVAQRLTRGGVQQAVVDRNLRVVKNGDRIDLGGRQLTITVAPGHTAGSIVVLDEQNGVLFSGDAFGSNNPTVPDALWMQSGPPLDLFLSSLRVARAEFRGKVKFMLTGHNDVPLRGERYLDNLETAAQTLIDKGDGVLVPSYRPAGLLQVMSGDRLKDPDWAGINVNRNRPISAAPDQIASLSNLEIAGATLNVRFAPETKSYTVEGVSASEIRVIPTATSTRVRSLAVNGTATGSGKAAVVRLTGPRTEVAVVVTSPDGAVSTTYTVGVSRKP